jgi:hypothetical protein
MIRPLSPGALQRRRVARAAVKMIKMRKVITHAK